MTTTSSIPSRSSGDPKVSRAWPVCGVDSHDAEGQAGEERREAADARGAEDAGDRREGEHHEREVVGRPEDEGQLGHGWRRERQHERGERAGDEGADRRGGEGSGAAAATRHAVALERRHDRAALAGGVQEDRRRGPAVHGAVEDGGEHDEGAGRVHLHRHGKEQGDRQRGADAREDPDRRPEDRADERPEEVQRGERHREAVGELAQGVHAQIPSGGKPGRERPRSREKRSQQATPSRAPTARSARSRREPNARAVRANVSAAAIGKPSGRMTRMGTTPAADGGPERRTGRTPARVGVLRLLRLEELAAGDGDEQQGAEDDEPGADDGREEAGPDDGVRGGLRKRERPVEPDEAEADDGDAEPPGAGWRPAPAAGVGCAGAAPERPLTGSATVPRSGRACGSGLAAT